MRSGEQLPFSGPKEHLSTRRREHSRLEAWQDRVRVWGREEGSKKDAVESRWRLRKNGYSNGVPVEQVI